MKKFEYLTQDGNILEEIDDLDALGEEGWELIGYYEDRDIALFKRELCDFAENDKLLTVPSIKPAVFFDNKTYTDERVLLRYRDMESLKNLFFGDGVGFKFTVENRTNHTLTVRAKSISINGFVVSSREVIVVDLGGNKKAIASISLYFNRNNLNDCDVYSADDITNISFTIEVWDKDEDETYESVREFFIAIDDNLPF